MIRQAILIDQHCISFVEGAVRRGRIDVKAFIRLPKGKFGDPERPGSEGFSVMLRDELGRLGWKPSTAAVILSSPSLIDRSLSLPPTRLASLPSVVQLQVEAMPMLKLQDTLCDFSIHRSDKGSMELGVAITSEATVNRIVAELGQSGFRVQSVTSAAHSMLTATKRIPGNEKFNLFVLASDRRIDLMAVRDGKLIASHTESIFETQSPTSDLIYPVVSRFLKAVQRKHEGFEPKDALLMCDDPVWGAKVSDRLEDEHDTNSQIFDYRMLFQIDSRSAPGKRSEQLCAESLLLAGALISQQRHRNETIDLLSPKRPKSRWFLKSLYAATAASLIGWLCLTGYRQLEQRKLEVEGRWAELHSEVDQLTTLNQKSERLLRVAAVVGDWEEARVDWLSELSALKQNLPEKNEAYLRQLVFQSSQDGELPAASAVGFAKDQSDIMEMNKRLSSASSPYEMDPRPFFQNEGAEPFIHQFELDLKVAAPAQGDSSNQEETSPLENSPILPLTNSASESEI